MDSNKKVPILTALAVILVAVVIATTVLYKSRNPMNTQTKNDAINNDLAFKPEVQLAALKNQDTSFKDFGIKVEDTKVLRLSDLPGPLASLANSRDATVHNIIFSDSKHGFKVEHTSKEQVFPIYEGFLSFMDSASWTKLFATRANQAALIDMENKDYQVQINLVQVPEDGQLKTLIFVKRKN